MKCLCRVLAPFNSVCLLAGLACALGGGLTGAYLATVLFTLGIMVMHKHVRHDEDGDHGEDGDHEEEERQA